MYGISKFDNISRRTKYVRPVSFANNLSLRLLFPAHPSVAKDIRPSSIDMVLQCDFQPDFSDLVSCFRLFC